MKISQSMVDMSSSHLLDQEDQLREKMTTRTHLMAGKSRTAGTRSRLAQRLDDQPAILMDRVSLFQTGIRETRSEYNHLFSSGARVSGVNGEEMNVFSREQAMEKLVSTVTGIQVSARILRDGDSIRQGRSPEMGSAISDSYKVTGVSTMTLNRTSSHFEQEQMTFSSTGQVTTEDGRTIDFSLDLAMDRSSITTTEEQTIIHTWQEQVALIDPLMISLDGSVPELGDIRFEFDLDNDGTTEEISFAAAGSGFLSFDKNNDGVINNGSELFGPGTGNGFGELGAYDLDGNGWIDENDEVFSQLSVWTKDENGNDVLTSLADAGIGAIYLDSADTGFDLTGSDNSLQGQIQRSGVFLFENGNVGSIQQVDLAARSLETSGVEEAGTGLFQEVNTTRITPSDLTGDQMSVQQMAVDEVENPLEEMIKQIREMQQQIRKIMNMETRSEKHLGRRRHRFNFGFLNRNWMQKEV